MDIETVVVFVVSTESVLLGKPLKIVRTIDKHRKRVYAFNVMGPLPQQ